MVVSYEVTWSSDGGDDNIEPVIISGDRTDYTITRLNEGSTYSITVTPINDAGRGDSLTFTISTTSGNNIVIHTLSVCVCVLYTMFVCVCVCVCATIIIFIVGTSSSSFSVAIIGGIIGVTLITLIIAITVIIITAMILKSRRHGNVSIKNTPEK